MSDQNNQLRMHAQPEALKGSYANFVEIAGAKEELILDFYAVNVARKHGTLAARIFLSPDHAKRLHAALGTQIAKFGKEGIAKPESTSDSEIGYKVTEQNE